LIISGHIFQNPLDTRFSVTGPHRCGSCQLVANKLSRDGIWETTRRQLVADLFCYERATRKLV